MAYIFSNEILLRTRRGGVARRSPIREFVSVVKSDTGTHLGICAKLAYKANLLKTALIGYDDESNRLLIKPTVDGNMSVSKNTNGGYKISARPFLSAVGLNDSLHGRYEAHINNDGDIIVELNKPLPEEEQSKRVRRKKECN